MKKIIKKATIILLVLIGILSVSSCKKEDVKPESYIIYDTLLNSNFYNTQIVIRDIIEAYDLNTMIKTTFFEPNIPKTVYYKNNLLIDYVEWYMPYGQNPDNSTKFGTYKSTNYTHTYTDSSLIQTGSFIYDLDEQINVKYVHILETKLVVK